MLRHVMLTYTLALLALVASGQGRAINISNTWVLPEEGFPVFYRYFRDRISWYEADAVCQFHHANLVTVDTTAQYDAVRAYLKELDISSAVWVGLIRSNPEGEFTWTDYRGLSGDGYWSSAPDARAAPLCAAANPAADYRWEARACGGPTVASFICELPVPQWALGNQGCMVRALPTLTVLYLPESAAVQLTTDCGLGGIKKVQCTGNVKRDDLLKNLSCADNIDQSTTTSSPVQSSLSSITTDSSFIDQDITSETTTEDILTTVRENDGNQPTTQLSSTPVIVEPSVKSQYILLSKLHIDQLHNNNIQNNDISKYSSNKEHFISKEPTSKIEDEKHLHHKMLNEELTRHGNFENIFTQPTDHFVPPLVMAKSKISDDMTVLSLAEKHAQQIAEDRFLKYAKPDEHLLKTVHDKILTKPNIEKPYKIEIVDKPLVMTLHSKLGDKKETQKYSVPKKYSEKYEDPKGKVNKLLDNKVAKIDKSLESSTLKASGTKNKLESTIIQSDKVEDNVHEADSIDLTVMLKELGMENSTNSLYSNHSNENTNKLRINDTFKKLEAEDKTTERITTVNQYTETQNKSNIVMKHEVIKIAIVEDNPFSSSPTPTIFEFTTQSPVFKDDKTEQPSSQRPEHTTNVVTSTEIVSQMTTTGKTSAPEEPSTTLYPTKSSSVYSDPSTMTSYKLLVTEKVQTTSNPNVNVTVQQSSTAEIKATSNIENTTTIQPIQSTGIDNATTVKKILSGDSSEQSPEDLETTSEYQHVTSDVDTTTQQLATNGRPEIYNFTTLHDDGYAKNWTDSLDDIDDSHSPLLSAANEPLHRPNRSRRPQQQPRISKFNPFRILG